MEVSVASIMKRHRLTEDEFRLLVDLAKTGMHYKQIGSKLGIAMSTVGDYLARGGLVKPNARRPYPPTIKIPQRDDLIYLAGFFDGEGNIKFDRWKDRSYQRRVGFRIVNANKDVMEWIANTVGGPSYHVKSPARNNWSTVYSWETLNRSDVYILLKLLEPHLKVKKHEAREVLAFLEENYLL